MSISTHQIKMNISIFSETLVPIFKVLELIKNFRMMLNMLRDDKMDHTLTNALFKLAFAIHNKEKEGTIQKMIRDCNFKNAGAGEYELNVFKKRENN